MMRPTFPKNSANESLTYCSGPDVGWKKFRSDNVDQSKVGGREEFSWEIAWNEKKKKEKKIRNVKKKLKTEEDEKD